MSDKKKTEEKKAKTFEASAGSAELASRSSIGLQGRGNDNLKNLENQVIQYLAGWQKALADYQNLQKEMDKKISYLGEFITSACILELLPIFDNYQIALNHIPSAQKKEQWAIGLEHTLKMWEAFLAEHHAQKIKTLGEKFDPNWHESLGEVDDQSQEDQIIVEEKQSGYKIKDKVIRPAKVIINNLK